ncbi:MAG: prepilin-type N-terminal cleavage/methylation domain-containing protein [Myxococcota bacterium]|nr:prepilin-type N-terminal cleavage/methylation domain-containing protein [Myxococcota bacterium]
MKFKRFTKGFTLIELTISVGIAALLATGVMAGKGFINACNTSRQGQAVERVRMAATDFLMLKATQMDNGALEELRLDKELVIRQLIPTPQWQVGEVTLNDIQFDAENRLLMISTEGSASQVNALTDYVANHGLFAVEPPDYLECTQPQQPKPKSNNSNNSKLCFHTSL